MKLRDAISAEEKAPEEVAASVFKHKNKPSKVMYPSSAYTSSAILRGTVRHRRFLPVLHGFHYRMFMMYLNLDELPHVFDRRWLWSVNSPNLACFKREDYYGNANVSLKTAISDLLQRETGQAARGPICLLTHLRYFGYCFNPVSFYYCFEADGRTLQAIVTDITNTPWGERHAYVLNCADKTIAPPPDASISAANAALDTALDIDQAGGWALHEGMKKPRWQRFQFKKLFHVSPFMPMEIDYDWSFSLPGPALHVHMQNKIAAKSLQPTSEPITSPPSPNKIFDATLSLRRQPITGKALAYMLLAYPLMTIKVIVAIYWQALLLSIKRVPFITHPEKIHADES